MLIKSVQGSVVMEHWLHLHRSIVAPFKQTYCVGSFANCMVTKGPTPAGRSHTNSQAHTPNVFNNCWGLGRLRRYLTIKMHLAHSDCANGTLTRGSCSLHEHRQPGRHRTYHNLC